MDTKKSECGKFRSNRYAEYAANNNTFKLNQNAIINDYETFARNWDDIFGHHCRCVCEKCLSSKPSV